jgi:malonate-semialdehyde dehydrogenase (acetylating)/methylmalonate-semialdehyde dehydrogenase
LPDGVFNVVNGDKEAVDALLAASDVQASSFVGSTPIARYIYTTGTAHGKRGSGARRREEPRVVLPTPIRARADALVGAAYGFAGERCMAISVAVFVGDADRRRCSRPRAAEDRAMKVGASDDKNAEMGPLVTATHRDKVKGLHRQRRHRRRIARRRRPRHRSARAREGYFVGPTLFDRVTPQMKIYKDEIFGPVLSSVRAKSYDEALALVNAHEFGNGARSSRATATPRAISSSACRSGWSASTCRSGSRSRSTASAAGSRRCLAITISTDPESVRFYTRQKAVTQRWPASVRGGAEFHMPTTK